MTPFPCPFLFLLFICKNFQRVVGLLSIFFSRPVIGETSTGMDVGAIVKRMTSFVHCFHFSIVRWVVSSMEIHQCENWIKLQSQINVPAVVWLKCMPFGAQIPIMNLRWQRRMLPLLPIICCALTYIGSWYVSMHEHPVCSLWSKWNAGAMQWWMQRPYLHEILRRFRLVTCF